MFVYVPYSINDYIWAKDLSQFQRKSAHAPQKELPKRKLEWKFMKITEMIISVFTYIK